MSNKKSLREALNAKLNMNDSTHGTLLFVIGGYLMYLAYGMVRDTLSGLSAMSMTTTVILAAVMGLAGLAVLVYGAREGLKAWNESRGSGKEDPDEM